MKILILTECGENVGQGHLARCVALYQAFEERGATPALVINGDNTGLYLLGGVNYQIFNWLKEKHKLFEITDSFDGVIIDSYLAPKFLYNKVSQAIDGKIIMIDDLNRLEYPKGIVVNPSIYGNTLSYPEHDEIIYLLGKDYIILRRDFWKVPKRHTRKRARNILVTFGGGEHNNYKQRLLEYLSANFSAFTYHIVGFDSRLKSRFNLNIMGYNNLSALGMRELMLKCDFCISAGGQTLYELIRTGTPVIAFSLAENQLLGLDFFSRKGAIINIGGFDKNGFLNKLASSIKKLMLYEERVKMVKNSRVLIDGQGAVRVVNEWYVMLMNGEK